MATTTTDPEIVQVNTLKNTATAKVDVFEDDSYWKTLMVRVEVFKDGETETSTEAQLRTAALAAIRPVIGLALEDKI